MGFAITPPVNSRLHRDWQIRQSKQGAREELSARREDGWSDGRRVAWRSSPAAARYALMRGLGLRRMGGLMYIVIRKYTKIRSVADAARRAKSGIGQILRESHGFRSYYVLDGGEGVGVAVMIFEDRESATRRTRKYRSLFKQVCLTLILETPKSSPGKFW